MPYWRLWGDDVTLVEKLKKLFKEKGVTVITIISAIGLLITTIVLTLTKGVGAVPASVGSKAIAGRQLEKLKRFLKYMATKAGAALPGLVGSIVSFFFKVAAKIVEQVARHLYLAMAAVVAVAVAYISKK